MREVTFPESLREICKYAFRSCEKLKTAYVKNDCQVDIGEYVNISVTVLPERKAKIGGKLLWDFRTLKDVILPLSIRKIGNYWFSRAAI